MSSSGRANLAGMSLDPKMAAEQLGSASRPFNMDDLGFNQLATVLPGVKVKHRSQPPSADSASNSACATHLSGQGLQTHHGNHAIDYSAGGRSESQNPSSVISAAGTSSYPAHRARRQRDVEPYIPPAGVQAPAYTPPANHPSQYNTASNPTVGPGTSTNQWSQSAQGAYMPQAQQQGVQQWSKSGQGFSQVGHNQADSSQQQQKYGAASYATDGSSNQWALSGTRQHAPSAPGKGGSGPGPGMASNPRDISHSQWDMEGLAPNTDDQGYGLYDGSSHQPRHVTYSPYVQPVPSGLPTHQRKSGQQVFAPVVPESLVTPNQPVNTQWMPQQPTTQSGHSSNQQQQFTAQRVSHPPQSQPSMGYQHFQKQQLPAYGDGVDIAPVIQPALVNVDTVQQRVSTPSTAGLAAAAMTNSSRGLYRRAQPSSSHKTTPEDDSSKEGAYTDAQSVEQGCSGGHVAHTSPLTGGELSHTVPGIAKKSPRQAHPCPEMGAPPVVEIAAPVQNKSSSSKSSSCSKSRKTAATGCSPAPPQFIEWAALQSSQEVSAQMESCAFDVSDATDAIGNTLLHRACEVGNISIVHFLRELYPSMNCSRMNSSGMQPLHLACEKGMLHIVMYLIDNDMADASARTSDGRTALHIAAGNSHIPLLQYLPGVMPSTALTETESRGFSALHLACMLGHDDAVSLLMTTPGVDVSQLDSVGRNCIDMAIILGHLSVVRLLLSLPTSMRPDMNARHGVHEYTGLHWACANLQYSIIKYLVHDLGADISVADASGLTPDKVVSDPVVTLLVTGSVSKREMKAMTDSIRDFNLSDDTRTDSTRMDKKIRKATGSHKQTTPDKGSDDDEGDGYSECHSDGEDSVGTGDVSGDGDRSASCDDRDEESPQNVDDKDSIDDINDEEDGDDDSVIDDIELFDWVKNEDNLGKLEGELGATPDIKCDVKLIRDEKTGETLLHEACKHEYLSTVQYLVEGVGADVNAVDKQGRSSLHIAVAASRLVIVKYLVKYAGAVLDSKDKKGMIPLDMCKGDSPDDVEIKKTISKSMSKSPEKRTKVVIPSYIIGK